MSRKWHGPDETDIGSDEIHHVSIWVTPPLLSMTKQIAQSDMFFVPHRPCWESIPRLIHNWRLNLWNCNPIWAEHCHRNTRSAIGQYLTMFWHRYGNHCQTHSRQLHLQVNLFCWVGLTGFHITINATVQENLRRISATFPVIIQTR